MRMQKRQFRIGQLAKQLGVERFVVRFWEKEFGIKTTRSEGGQRFYSEDDLNTFTEIKKLLYQEGFTIAGAKKQLSESDEHATRIIASQRTTIEENHQSPNIMEEHKDLIEQMTSLKKRLSKLRELL